MKTKLVLWLILLPAMTFASCDKDDDHVKQNSIPQEVWDGFNEKYPTAKHVEWEMKGEYTVAEFILNNCETSAWFDANGVWYMTETDLAFNSLPETVKNAFAICEYRNWKVDDIDMLERKDREVIYIIEVEEGKKEVDLFFSADGLLIKTVEDMDSHDRGNNLPQVVPSDIVSFINDKYPGCRIVEFEQKKNKIEVDIVHDKKAKEVVFDLNKKWMYTSWDVRIQDLPPVVGNVIKKPEYAGYKIDEADFFETSGMNYYLLELEKGKSEIKIKVDENGTVQD